MLLLCVDSKDPDQSDLSLCWAHWTFNWFCHAPAQMLQMSGLLYVNYFTEIQVFNTNNVYPEQVPHSAAPDLDLHCFRRFLNGIPVLRHMSHRMTKPTKWHLHPAKTPISRGIRPVWSVFAVRMKKPLILSYPLNAQRWLWSDWAELSPLWAHVILLVLSCSILQNKNISSVC